MVVVAVHGGLRDNFFVAEEGLRLGFCFRATEVLLAKEKTDS